MSHGWTGGQFSVARAVCAACLCVAFLQYASVRPDALARALLHGAAHATSHRTLATAASAVFTAACLALALGIASRWMALVLALVWFASDAWSAEQRTLGVAVGGVLALFAIAPRDPYLAWSARGRIDPAGGWILPNWIHGAGWILLAAVDVHVLRTIALADLAPAEGFGARAFTALGWLLYLAPLALPSRARAVLWLASIALQLACASHMDLGVYGAAALVLLHVFTFDPGWVRRRGASATDELFYDGACGLCHRFVRFVLAEDASGRALRFAPLHGAHFRARFDAQDAAALPDSVVVRTLDGRVLVRSEAVIHVLARLGGVWRVVALALALVPSALRDRVYDALARMRERLFATPPDACPLLPKHLRSRFEA